MSDIHVLHHPGFLALGFPSDCRVLSSAVLNGGLAEASSFLNMKVAKQAAPPWHCPAETLARKVAELGLSSATVGMMTAASMQSLAYDSQENGTLRAECWVTAGLSNLRRVGDAADAVPLPGTINICLYVNQPLSDAALAEALIMLTESKVTAIRDAGLLSLLSGLPASGTGTDSHAVFCRKEGEAQVYCGKHTLIGELIGKAVLNACAMSLEKCRLATE